jgi:hypothetical protein
MEGARNFIFSRYGALIEPIMYTKRSRNLLVILNPRIQASDKEEEEELRADFGESNIYFGPHQKRK